MLQILVLYYEKDLCFQIRLVDFLIEVGSIYQLRLLIKIILLILFLIHLGSSYIWSINDYILSIYWERKEAITLSF